MSIVIKILWNHENPILQNMNIRVSVYDPIQYHCIYVFLLKA